MAEQEPSLPSRSNVGAQTEDRIYRTALPAKEYLALETEALERGLKAFSLTKTIMTLYLQKKLVLVKELPPELQGQIVTHFKTKQSAARQSLAQGPN